MYNDTVEMLAKVPKTMKEVIADLSIPEEYPDYVPFGFYKDLTNIIKSNMFYPIFITGLSGNGKTLMVEQVCAKLKRECIRVNISIETDETDLIGGPTLVNGNVVNRDGPVLIAMKKGAVLLIDEVDRGSNKLLCLQAIMEGKPYYNKKTGEVVHPAEGFNVIATANTKGRGSDEGKYLSQILDDAFIERFPITVEQEYPDIKTEKKILKPLINDNEFVDKLVQWADVVRKTYNDGGVDEMISTRRLVHIAKAYKIFGDKMKAIELCVNRFDTDTKLSFLDVYRKIDETIEAEPEPEMVEIVFGGNDASAVSALSQTPVSPRSVIGVPAMTTSAPQPVFDATQQPLLPANTIAPVSGLGNSPLDIATKSVLGVIDTPYDYHNDPVPDTVPSNRYVQHIDIDIDIDYADDGGTGASA
jgi:hypothetical protein